MDINKIVSTIKSLREDTSGSPTVNIGSGNIAGTQPAGDDPPVFQKNKYRTNYAKGGRGSRKWWLQFLNGK